MNNHWLTLNEIMQVAPKSYEQVQNTLHEELGCEKVELALGAAFVYSS